MVAFQNLLLLGLPVAIAGAALEQRAPKSPFGLYAYGDGIGGAPVFTSGRKAYIGNSSLLEDIEAAPVEFMTTSDEELVGSPNTTANSGSPTWSNVTLLVPDTSSDSHQVGFTNSTPGSGMSANGFVFYGEFLLHKSSDGNLKSLWYAVPLEQDGIWSLEWNSTGDDTSGQILLTLKATAPSHGKDKAQ
ncbi:hypothetical protein F4820DRAFT_430871 [Hypoxylon rubiginosum]|uniref:Uncharacterized protein n=1 Tax=Hypoxylon rubiginosum TaxID=110542 RepID=A0ACB9YUF6_9PEZI|nr:hypothetical protein F4820DRAFT_430871 [Hypoxylon rubiginosum]